MKNLKAKVEYLPNKSVPTWVVIEGTNRTYFSEKSCSVFDNPKKLADKLAARINKRLDLKE
jgi:hypothetical protein